jgi:hypothetical protein
MVFLNHTGTEEIEDAMRRKLAVMDTIKEEAMSDEEDESYNLLNYYLHASPEERSIMDCVLVCVCGWTMSTIIEKSEPGEDYDESESWLDE